MLNFVGFQLCKAQEEEETISEEATKEVVEEVTLEEPEEAIMIVLTFQFRQGNHASMG